MAKNILLINCYHQDKEEKVRPYVECLQRVAKRSGFKMDVTMRAESEISIEADGAHDVVILSGSYRMIAAGEIDPTLLDFIRHRGKPLLGICYAHQALARAFGAVVEKDARSHVGSEAVIRLKETPLLKSFPPRFPMDQSHEEVVRRDDVLLGTFELLAVNEEGGVEIIHHLARPLWGVQFHPERSGEWGERLLANFLQMTVG